VQVKSSGADTEKALEEKLLVIPAGLVRRCVLEERNTYRAANIAFFKFYAPVPLGPEERDRVHVLWWSLRIWPKFCPGP